MEQQGTSERVSVRTFSAELKRRKVYRVAVSYAVVGWLLIQVAATTFPILELPAWATRLVVILVVLGFLPALILAWAFDLTPGGIRRADDADPNTSPLRRHSRSFTIVIGIAGAVAAGLLAVQLSRPKSAGDKSIAILPFESLSEDKANAYFAVGVEDEILTRLARIADLKVISRTSTQGYKSAGENLPEIAKQLGVEHIVEGRVQKAGDAVRVNVKLIRAATDAHIWAETYDRKVTDVFAIQSEIAASIADALDARLTGREKRAFTQKPTENAAAYDAYLRGLASIREGTPRGMDQAVAAFEEAVRLDPSFAAAWAMLARSHSRVFFTNFDATPARRDAAKHALDEALRLQPKLPEVQLSEGFYHYLVLRDFEEARRLFERLQRRLPNHSEIPAALGAIARRQGRWAESDAYFDRVVVLNPRDRTSRIQAAAGREFVRNFAEAIRLFDEGLKVVPGNATLLARKARIYQALGDLDRADELLREALANGDPPQAIETVYMQAALRRQYPSAIELLRRAVTQSSAAYQRNVYRRWLGDLERLNGDSAAAAATYGQARAELEEILAREPENVGVLEVLAGVHAGLGDREAALQYADRAVSVLPISKDAVAGLFYEQSRAQILAMLGEKDHALPEIERMLRLSGGSPPLTPAILRLHPDFDSLRDDPRFAKLAGSAR